MAKQIDHGWRWHPVNPNQPHQATTKAASSPCAVLAGGGGAKETNAPKMGAKHTLGMPSNTPPSARENTKNPANDQGSPVNARRQKEPFI
jgi:hypothetical protein